MIDQYDLFWRELTHCECRWNGNSALGLRISQRAAQIWVHTGDRDYAKVDCTRQRGREPHSQDQVLASGVDDFWEKDLCALDALPLWPLPKKAEPDALLTML
jgi:hypothetical protein